MSQNNIHAFLISISLCVFCVLILSKRSSCSDHQACVPSNCENGPNITYPFYISGQQESYCGSPGFMLNCSHNGFPVLQLPGNEFVVEDIFYETNSLRVIKSAFSSLNSSDCLRGTGNMTWPFTDHLYSADNVKILYLFSNCTNPVSSGVFRSCDEEYRYDQDWAFIGRDENFQLENCGRSMLVPVEQHVEDVNLTGGGLVEVLRRGFVLHWNATDCSACRLSGGNCASYGSYNKFICSFPDGFHGRSCKPRKIRLRLILISSFAAVLVLTSIVILITLIKRAKKKKKKKE